MSGATGRGGLAFLGGAFGVGVAAILVKNVLPKDLTRTRRDSLAASGGEYRMLSSEVQLEIRGLQNVGNSCFINAVLQSLASLPPFREYLEVSFEGYRDGGGVLRGGRGGTEVVVRSSRSLDASTKKYFFNMVFICLL